MISLAELAKAYTAYRLQSNCSKTRVDRNGNPIEMRLSFDDWLQIWLDSGKWDQRGTRKGQYCMSRINDLGHYEKGNVEIKLTSENSSEATSRPRGPLSEEHKLAVSEALKSRHFSDEHRRKLSESKQGKPRDEATKAKLSAANKGKGWSEARKAAQAARKTSGKTSTKGWTPEQRAKFAATVAARKS